MRRKKTIKEDDWVMVGDDFYSEKNRIIVPVHSNIK